MSASRLKKIWKGRRFEAALMILVTVALLNALLSVACEPK